MVHRTPEGSNFGEESSIARKFPSSLSRKNSSAGGSFNDYYQQDAYIYYLPHNKEYFEGPFSELQCQFWYKEGFFYNALEFKLGVDAPTETLESLKERNGRECPFFDGVQKAAPSVSSELMTTLLGRVVELADEIEKMKEDGKEQKMERDALQNRVKELMEKDTRSEQYRRETEQRLSEMKTEIEDLQEGMANLHAITEREASNASEEDPVTVVESRSSVTNADQQEQLPLEEDIITGVTSSASCDEISEVRTELERLHANIHSLDRFSFKLSHKVEKLKCKYKVVDVIGEGLNSKDGVFDRLAYLEHSVEEIQAAMALLEEGGKTTQTLLAASTPPSTTHTANGYVFPGGAENRGERLSNGSSLTDEWYSPSEKFVTPERSDAALFPPMDFSSASNSIVAVTEAAWPPGLEQIVDDVVAEQEVEDWESIADDDSEQALDDDDEGRNELEAGTLPIEDTVVVAGDVDKENRDVKMEGGGAEHLELIGKGLELFLHSSMADCDDICADADIDRLLAAVKGAKMLTIAESLKHYFVKPMFCDTCSTGEKRVELRNAIEYFEHLNRSHFKKCGGADRTLVNQFAYLLEQFKVPVPVPISIVKRQYAEREKNKPWLKREGTTSPTRKTLKKRK